MKLIKEDIQEVSRQVELESHTMSNLQIQINQMEKECSQE